MADLWWLRRNGGEVYSQPLALTLTLTPTLTRTHTLTPNQVYSQSQLEGEHPPVDLMSEIRMVVDTDAGTVHSI